MTTTDGVGLGGIVHGKGPPVFLYGAQGDGDIDWQAVLSHLTGRFTCDLPSMRGRGLSGHHPWLSDAVTAEHAPNAWIQEPSHVTPATPPR